ncbi:aldo/keto reductase [Streptomyces mirabilis]
MAWVLHNPVVSAPIVGATKPHHLADAIAALDIQLTGDEIDALDAPYAPRLPTLLLLTGRHMPTVRSGSTY